MKVRLAAVGSLLGLAVAGLPSTVNADSVGRVDARNDAPAGIDITRVEYRHHAHRVSARVRVPDLARTGRVSLAISKFDVFEAGYVAVVRRRSDGTVSRRLTYFNHFDTTPRSCRVRGTWDRSDGVVTVSVPRRCLDGHRRERIYTAARALRGGVFDDAPSVRRLQRG